MKPLLLPALFLLPLVAAAAAPPKASPAPAPLLPPSFADWKLSAPAHTAATPQAADSAHAAVLQEDGLTQFAAGAYTKASGQTLQVRAFRFGDATGAYAAFTFYRQPAMRSAQNTATEANHFLLWRGATVVDCTFTKGEAAPEALQALAAALPPTGGTAGIPPPLPTYLAPGAVPGSEHYSIGPAAYAASGNPVPAEVIDFSRDAEVVSGSYRPRSGGGPGAEAQLTLVMYPTPQMAVNRERALTGMAATLGPGFEEKRLGAMLAYTTGSLAKPEADKLLGGIRYKTEVIIDHPEGYVSEVAKAAKLLLGIGYLTAILGVAAVILAVFLGAGRVLVRRLRGKPLSSMNDDDFISLKIDG